MIFMPTYNVSEEAGHLLNIWSRQVHWHS